MFAPVTAPRVFFRPRIALTPGGTARDGSQQDHLFELTTTEIPLPESLNQDLAPDKDATLRRVTQAQAP